MRARVFIGSTHASLGLSGSLMIRIEDWPDFKAEMEKAGAEVLALDEKVIP